MKILTIGRDESCNIVLSDSTVSRRHAILKIHATGKMEIISMGQNGTFVNGVKLKSDTAYPVTRKDVVSFAHVRQLDWNQIPDVQRYYRYGIMAVIGLAVIITAIVVIQDMKDDTPRLPVIECQQEEKVLPEKEVAPQAEVKKKQDSLSEKKEKNEVSSCFFPKKKTKDKKKNAMHVIAVDAMGGDNAPQAIVEGVNQAIADFKDIEIQLYGDEA